MKLPIKVLALTALLAGILTIAPRATAHDGAPPLDPASVEATIFPGESLDIQKTVHTPEIPPQPEIYFLVDTTGSMDSVIASVQADIGTIISAVEAAQPSARFGLGEYRDFPSDAFAFNHRVPIGPDDGVGGNPDVSDDVGSLAATGGGDGSEGQFFALDQLAEAANPAGFTPGASNIIVWIGDAPAHDPVCDAISGLPYDIDEASVIAKLDAPTWGGDGITTVAVSTSTGFPAGLDDDPTLSALNYLFACGAPGGAAGQASRITAATGGVALFDVAPADVADAVVAAIADIEVDVSMESTCASTTGGVIDTTFAPPMQTVVSGEDAIFTETISVAADAPGGTYICRDVARIDGELLLDDADQVVSEIKTILVPENFVTGGGHITEGRGKNRVSVLNFGGNAGYMADGSLVGHWNFNFRDAGVHIQTTEITDLQFFDTGVDPAPPDADADTAVMSADARVRVGNGGWDEPCEVVALFQDGGEPQEDVLIAFEVGCASGAAFAAGDLTGGNIQIHDGTKG